MSNRAETNRCFVHFASKNLPAVIYSYSAEIFLVNDKRSRRSWSYNHNLRLLLALHRIQLPDGYTLFHFIHSQLSIAALPDFSIVTPARNLPDGFHNECIIIQCACRYIIHTAVMCGIAMPAPVRHFRIPIFTVWTTPRQSGGQTSSPQSYSYRTMMSLNRSATMNSMLTGFSWKGMPMHVNTVC